MAFFKTRVLHWTFINKIYGRGKDMIHWFNQVLLVSLIFENCSWVDILVLLLCDCVYVCVYGRVKEGQIAWRKETVCLFNNHKIFKLFPNLGSYCGFPTKRNHNKWKNIYINSCKVAFGCDFMQKVYVFVICFFHNESFLPKKR